MARLAMAFTESIRNTACSFLRRGSWEIVDRAHERLSALHEAYSTEKFVHAVRVAADKAGCADGRHAERSSEAAIGAAARELTAGFESAGGCRPAVDFERLPSPAKAAMRPRFRVPLWSPEHGSGRRLLWVAL